jgi:GH43 family beta-xylosidase
MEAPVGGLVSPTGRSVYLYSGGSFSDFYAVGTLVEDDGQLWDVTHGTTGFVLHPDPERGFFAPGHCSWLRAVDGTDYLLFHARFGALTAKRQMALARLLWDENGLPYAAPVS